MNLKVKRTDNEEIVNVRKYIKSKNPTEEHIWCNEWYGHHIIGNDCEWCDGNDIHPSEKKNVSISLPIEKCKLIEVTDDFIDCDVTDCCNVGPIVNENYCPKCGKMIVRK